jgi:predicted ATPase/DNA-binding CsgD family transcriptional regulator
MPQDLIQADPPQPLTPLIGRERELDAVMRRLLDPDVRMLTLIGPGGVGKTRLALAAARELASRWRDGVAFVPLASIAEAEAVVPAMARALGLETSDDEPPFDVLAARLEERSMLLVLDNLEQVASAAPDLARLLGACPRVTMLTTSRIPLGVRGEREFPVEPIALPALDASAKALEHSDAVRLFVALSPVDRARLIRNDGDLVAIAEICRRLDGLPLAIELAAARAAMLPPAAMLVRLDRRLPLLTGGPSDLPERQRALRRTIAWSCGLLSPSQQRLFRIASLFHGSTADGLEAVAGGEAFFDDLAALVQHSLVKTVDGADGQTRYVMLETIREYGLEELDASGERPAVQTAHAAFHADLAERAAAELSGPEQASWLRRMDQEAANFQTALEWSIAQIDAPTAARLAGWLGRWWLLRGALREGRAWLERVAAMAGEPDPNRARALTALGAIAEEQGDHAAAIAAHNESLAVSRALGDRYGVARATNNLGLVRLGQNDLAAAKADFAAALQEFVALGNQPAASVALINAATVADRLGDAETAERLLTRALTVQRKLGDRQRVALTLQTLGLVATASGELQRAETAFQEAIRIWSELGDESSVARTLAHRGRLARLRGESEIAAGLLAEGLNRAADQEDDQLTIALCCLDLMVIAWQRGELDAAARLLAAADAGHDWRAAPLRPDERRDYDRAEAALRRELGKRMGDHDLTGDLGASIGWALEQAARFQVAPAKPVVSSKDAHYHLTPRELDVLRQLVDGKTDKEIGDELFISHRTVMRHVTGILEKLEVSSRTAAAALAVRESLI